MNKESILSQEKGKNDDEYRIEEEEMSNMKSSSIDSEKDEPMVNEELSD
jgi:hypothetical protein